jgi:ectoine hydroxylase-related dioxygenase (phytanoyl-CoA dioxygenase family)
VNLDEGGYSEEDAVNIKLQPGDISIHRPATLHAAYANTSDRWRRGFAARYTSTQTKMKNINTGRTEAFLVRGSPGDEQHYREFPYYDTDKNHMEFNDWQEYNERAKQLNNKLSDSYII